MPRAALWGQLGAAASPRSGANGQGRKGRTGAQEGGRRGGSHSLSPIEDGETKATPGAGLDFASDGGNLLGADRVDHPGATPHHLGLYTRRRGGG